MGIKIHGSPFSGATLRVVAAANEKELDFEFVHVDMSVGAHKQQPYVALNPFGQVPAFEDDDLQLFESRAITKYIAYAYGSNGNALVCEDMKQKASQAVWMEVEAHQFDPPASKLMWELVFKGMFGMEVDMAIVEENEAKLAKVLDVYEAHLGQSKYMCCETFSLADLHHLPQLHFLMGTQVKKIFDERPHVSAWCTDILARPAWVKTIALQNQA
ncbi:glutathione S-transferase-like [Chenopodium quinoa]|uniref:glutathione transferase n=1 Tax=Chenopodium quinoa TaxID=63459 RepID=A0A803MPH8_CHEQI|nr:glutathione S-transferase-like [Chenopodium quinoa]